MNSPVSPDLLMPGDGNVPDIDPQETQEWREAFEALVAVHGKRRGAFLLDQLSALARREGIDWRPSAGSAYVNTIPVGRQPDFPGDLSLEERLGAVMRWNALAMVVRA